MPWTEGTNDQFTKVARTLAKNSIRGCGEFYLRPNSKSPENEFLVGCSRDGLNWLYYIVFTVAETVQGPYNSTVEYNDIISTIEDPR